MPFSALTSSINLTTRFASADISVDIFNEGVDIPRVNQIIMLRPTQSAIVFVQQLGRGLRKATTRNTLRKLLAGESDVLPGASTVNFERIAKERIFAAIDSANMSRKADLVNDYTLLKFQLGRSPMMMDFVAHGSRDPYLYVEASRSYYNFVAQQEPDLARSLGLTKTHMHLLELFSKEIANGKRVEEAVMLQLLIDQGAVDLEALKSTIFNAYKYVPTHKTLLSAVNKANFLFVTENSVPAPQIDNPQNDSPPAKASKIKVGLKYNYHLVDFRDNQLLLTGLFQGLLSHPGFRTYLADALAYGVHSFSKGYDVANWVDGFVLARKYSRKDAFRILNWDENPVAQNVGGYMVSSDKADCAAFINYHKDDSISATTQYEDAFVDRGHFDWMSKSKRSVTSPDVVAITGHVALGMRIPLFVKKHNDEGQDFYYIGDMEHLPGKVSSVVMADGKTSAVRMGFKLSHGVESGLYRYITDKGEA